MKTVSDKNYQLIIRFLADYESTPAVGLHAFNARRMAKVLRRQLERKNTRYDKNDNG